MCQGQLLVCLLGTPQKEQATQLSPTFRESRLVPYRLSNCQSRVCEFPWAQVNCLCEFPPSWSWPPALAPSLNLFSIKEKKEYGNALNLMVEWYLETGRKQNWGSVASGTVLTHPFINTPSRFLCYLSFSISSWHLLSIIKVLHFLLK